MPPLNDLQKANLRSYLIPKTSVIDNETGAPVDWSSLGGTDTAEVQALIDASISDLVASAPGALNTLDELAAALGDDANYAATITTALAGKQPLDADLTAIAALTTTSYGRALLALADQAALQTAVGAQPLDSDLTAIAALTTTSFGRGFLALADAAAMRALTGTTPLTVGAGATAFWADGVIPRLGSGIIADIDGNAFCALVQWYRAGSFNSVNGVTVGNQSNQFQNNTYSAGGTGFSFFIESNSAGGRLGVKNNNGFGRDLTIRITHP